MAERLTELLGVDLKDYGVYALTPEAFGKPDFQLYPPHRTHFLIHAIQFGRPLPSEDTMLRCERRNEIKSGAAKAQAALANPDPNLRRRPPPPRFIRNRRGGFRMPPKIGEKVLTRKEAKEMRQNRQAPFRLHPSRQLPPGFMRPYGGLPLGIPQMGVLPMGIPQMGVPPMGVPQMGVPPMSVPQIGNNTNAHGLLGAIVPVNGMNQQGLVPPTSSIPVYSHLVTYLPTQRAPSSGRVVPKEASTAFRVLAPEEVLLKSVRRAFQEKFELWRAETLKITPRVKKEVVVQPDPAPRGSQRNAQRGGRNQRVNQRQAKSNQMQPKQPLILQLVQAVDVSQFSRELDDRPLYFQKKKANQKRRRQEKHLLIKENKKELVKVYGDSIFKSFWPVSRREILETLGKLSELPQPEEELGEFFEGQEPPEPKDAPVTQEQ